MVNGRSLVSASEAYLRGTSCYVRVREKTEPLQGFRSLADMVLENSTK